MIAGVVVGATATSGSRGYVLPTFTTLLVLVVLLARDPQDAGERFRERVSETALGVAVVALVVLPAVLRRRAAVGQIVFGRAASSTTPRPNSPPASPSSTRRATGRAARSDTAAKNSTSANSTVISV